MKEDKRRDTEENILSRELRMPCGHKMGNRNLVVCIDGTSNQFGAQNTNVVELYNLLLKGEGDNQKTWYNSGIGTYAPPSWKFFNHWKQSFYHKIDLAIAWEFERTVFAAYRWLSDNYEKGDRIFLFGFSRGAYQVRVLSAMIDKVGLIHKGNEMQIPFAYELYADPKSDLPVRAAEVGSQRAVSMAERFKSAFSHKSIKVHFVGAWDTVSSIGILRGKELPRTTNGMNHVCYFRHALALDERRVKFLPEYAHGGGTKLPRTRYSEENSQETKNEDGPNLNAESPDKSPPSEMKDMVNYSKIGKELAGDRPQSLEVWFVGTHSDIGGGNVENISMDRAMPPLRWMVFEARAVGLLTTRFKRDSARKKEIQLNESLKWYWWPLEFLPFKRSTLTRRDDGKQFTHWFHRGSSRKIHPGQRIHASLLWADVSLLRGASVILSDPDQFYIPKARPPIDDPLFWRKLRDYQSHIDFMVLDLYESIQLIVEGLLAGHLGTIATLQEIATSADGWQAVYEKVVSALRKSDEPLEPEVKHRFLESVMNILEKNRTTAQLELYPPSEIHILVSDLWKSSKQEYRKLAQEFVARFTDPCIQVLSGHNDVVCCVTFSPGGGHVASSSYDQTIRIWNVETEDPVGKPLEGHTDKVYSVAFSMPGERLVSGSRDNTLRIWNVETDAQVGQSFKHDDSIVSVASSPDGRLIASGSHDKTIRIWHVETGRLLREPLKHVSVVDSVAFSPDGEWIVSGSRDRNVWIWDLTTEDQGRPFHGHSDSVLSVAFAPNGKYVVSGSKDHTVRIWNVATGKQVGEPLEGHSDWVGSVAVSFDSKLIVSGSDDGTILLWELETRTQRGEPFQAHKGAVFSVAFSPDSKRLVSGSEDCTIRIWDVGILCMSL